VCISKSDEIFGVWRTFSILYAQIFCS